MRFQIVGDTRHERRLRTYDHKPNLFVEAECGDRVVVGDVKRGQFGDFLNARVPRRTIEPLEERTLRYFPGQRVFATAAADKKNVHDYRAPLVPQIPGLYALLLRIRSMMKVALLARE